MKREDRLACPRCGAEMSLRLGWLECPGCGYERKAQAESPDDEAGAAPEKAPHWDHRPRRQQALRDAPRYSRIGLKDPEQEYRGDPLAQMKVTYLTVFFILQIVSSFVITSQYQGGIGALKSLPTMLISCVVMTLAFRRRRLFLRFLFNGSEDRLHSR